MRDAATDVRDRCRAFVEAAAIVPSLVEDVRRIDELAAALLEEAP